MIAVDSRDPGLCSKVSPNATFVDLGGRTALLRSRCYVALAHDTRDAALCGQLPRADAFPYVNNQYDSLESCRTTVAIYSRPDFKSDTHVGSSPFPRPSDFEEALRQIGYPNPYARSRVAKPTPDDYWKFMATLSREGSPEERNELIRRVMSLQ